MRPSAMWTMSHGPDMVHGTGALTASPWRATTYISLSKAASHWYSTAGALLNYQRQQHHRCDAVTPSLVSLWSCSYLNVYLVHCCYNIQVPLDLLGVSLVHAQGRPLGGGADVMHARLPRR